MNRLALAFGIVLLVLGTVPLASAALAHVPVPKPEFDTQLPIVKHVFPTIEKRFAGSGNQASPNMQYHEGAVHHAPHVYLVFWGWLGPNNAVTDPDGEGAILTSFFAGVGGSAWAGVQAQFADRAGAIGNPTSQLAGVWYDDDVVNGFPVQPDLFLANEALRAEGHFGYDPNGDYMVLTPHLHNDAQFGVGYCAWHSWQQDAQGRSIAFSDLPYMPDAASTGCPGNFVNAGSKTDAATLVAGHEYAEALTDPYGAGWYDTNGAGENGDKCNWNAGTGARAQNIVLSTGTFPVQALWSNVASACAVSYAGAPGAALDPSSGGGGNPPPTPPAYHESGSVTIMTSQAVFVGTQHSQLGQGTTTWKLVSAEIKSHAGFRFWLNATGTGAGVNDFDLYFFDDGGNSVGSSGAVGDEAGVLPVAATQAYVILSTGAPATFGFDAE